MTFWRSLAGIFGNEPGMKTALCCFFDLCKKLCRSFFRTSSMDDNFYTCSDRFGLSVAGIYMSCKTASQPRDFE